MYTNILLFNVIFLIQALERNICFKIAERPYITELDLYKELNLSKIEGKKILKNKIFKLFNVSKFGLLKIVLLVKNFEITSKTLLSSCELKNIVLLLEGHTFNQIAKIRNLSLHTVKTQIRWAIYKYDVDNIYDVILKIFEIQDGLKSNDALFDLLNIMKFEKINSNFCFKM
jgi:DNA-binding CsgD family transcriptional regulator